MDKVNNSRLKKPFLTRIDHIFIQPHRLISKVQIQKKNDNLGKNGEKSWMPTSGFKKRNNRQSGTNGEKRLLRDPGRQEGWFAG